MKKAVFAIAVVLVFGTVGWAQMMGGSMMNETEQSAQEEGGARDYGYGMGYGMGPGMMGGYGGYGMGPGMMGGYGMGPGMMGGYGGYGMGPGMMGAYGPGYGMGRGMMGMMGPGMMGNMMHGGGMGYGMMGYGMGPGMMGGYGMGPGMMGVSNPEMQKFLDETTDLRKEIIVKQFEYAEAQRNSKTKPEDLKKLGTELRDLTVKLYQKMPVYGYGQ